MSLSVRSRIRFRSRATAVGAAVGGLVVTSLAAVSAADAEELPEQEPGVTLRTYDVQIPLDEVCTLKEGQTPNVDKLMPAIDFAADADFGVSDLFVSHTIANLHVPADGQYDFRLISDDGSVLYIDDEVVIDHDGLHGAEPKDGSVELTEGVHPLRIEHFDQHHGQVVRLEWQKPGDSGFSLVPNEVLTTDAGVVRVTSPGRKECEGDFDTPGDGLKLTDVHPGYDLVDLRPEGFEPQVTALNWTEDGRLALATWGADDQQGTSEAGEVYLLDGVREADGPEDVTATLVAEGLREPQGIIEVDGDLYVSEKDQLTQLVDTDGDDVVDEYNQIATWPFDGNFHEFAFGLLYRDGYFYLNLSVSIDYGGATTDPQGSPNRGTHVKVDKETGDVEYIAGGLRTPNGIGWGPDGDVFVNDNQGGWLPANKMVHVQPDRFFNHFTNPDGPFDDQPVTKPVLWMPHNEIANSPSTPVQLDQGPFAGQMVWGDVTYGGVQRGFLEKVEGEYQGAVFRHSHGLESGINRTLLDDETGALIVGGLGAGGNWGEAGKLTYGLQKLEPNGTDVFDIKEMRAIEGGFELEYTKPLSDATIDGLAEAYEVQQWGYAPTKGYGGPKIDEKTLPVTSATLSDDGTTVTLQIDGLQENRVVHVRSPRPFSADDDEQLWGTSAWYTLNELPGEEPTPVFYEAEEGTILEDAGFDTEHAGFSGGGFVDQLGGDNLGSGSRVTVEVDDGGAYDVGIRYANGPNPFQGEKTMSLFVNDEFVKQLELPTTQTWKEWAMAHETIALDAGVNTIQVSVGEDDTGHINLDAFSVRPAGERIALFDESGDQGEWQHTDGRAPEWPVDDGAMTVGGGDLRTKESFGDFRLHVEFWLPEYPPDVTGQNRANSGVYLQERYEIQVLDSFGVDPLQDNDSAAIYQQKAADENAATEPETWQSYDIEYYAAEYDEFGNKTANPRVSVWWNDTLVHDDVEILRGTGGNIAEGPSEGSIRLQDHGNPVRYRNIWAERLDTATVADAPTDLSGSVDGDDVTLSWTAPDDGGAQITGYVVTPFIDGEAQDAIDTGSTDTTHTVSSVEDDVEGFTVAAVNVLGTGAESEKWEFPDEIAPNLTVSGLADGGEYGDSGVRELTVEATDDRSGVERLRVSLDGDVLHDGEAEFTTELQLWQLDLDDHELLVEVWDAADNLTSEQVEFAVTTSVADVLTHIDRLEDEDELSEDEAKTVRRHVERADKHLDRDKLKQYLREIYQAVSDTWDIESDSARQLLLRDLTYLMQYPA